jgi:hypothetical protein
MRKLLSLLLAVLLLTAATAPLTYLGGCDIDVDENGSSGDDLEYDEYENEWEDD